MVLEEELRTYGEQKAALLGVARGEYVLIKGKDVLGTFETEGDAIRVGYRALGNVPFLVKEIREVDATLTSTRDIGVGRGKLKVH